LSVRRNTNCMNGRCVSVYLRPELASLDVKNLDRTRLVLVLYDYVGLAREVRGEVEISFHRCAKLEAYKRFESFGTVHVSPTCLVEGQNDLTRELHGRKRMVEEHLSFERASL